MGGLTISQPLLNASTTPALMSPARMIRATTLTIERQRQQIKAQVAQVYYQLLATREAETIAAGAAALAQQQLELSKRMLDAGSETKRAVLQAELRASQAQRQVLTTAQNRLNAEHQYREVIGPPPDTLEWTDNPSILPESVESAEEQASESRQDLKADALNYEAARLNTTVMKLNWLPRIDGTFDIVYTENSSFVGEPFFWTAGIRASIPLWDGGARLAQIRRAASQQRLADIERSKPVAGITRSKTSVEIPPVAQQTLSAVQTEPRPRAGKL